MTYDQPARITEGRKDDTGKLRYDLVPPDALAELVHVYTVGAARYGDRNWERGISYGRVFAALMRHAWAWWRGEELDPDDGLPHLAHAAWNCLTLLAYRLREMDGFDDRPGLRKMDGGAHHPDNMQALCRTCNAIKSSMVDKKQDKE